MEEYRIIIIATKLKWKCLPSSFTECPTEPQYFESEFEFDSLLKSKYDVIDECETPVHVTSKFGFDASIKPKKFRLKQNN